MENRTKALDMKLESYAKSDFYPFHMPGHKRSPIAMPNPYQIDITEIDGFDDLHHPKEILKEAQQRAAGLYGAGRSYYLVNGSTCGLLAAVSASVPRNGKILMARNAHKAVYHAAYIRGLSVVYLNPCMTAFGIQGAVDPQEVRTKLKEDSGIDAVLITSPTYEGVVSDISAIADIAHEYGVPLLVDEAHGAHFGLHEAFPESAVRLGADLVVQSLHKVLPALTQTALLHINSDRSRPLEVEKFLNIYETSSPSYVLMASMEKCIRLLSEQKEELFCAYDKRLSEFYQKCRGFSKIHVMAKEDFSLDEVFDLDRSKLVISVKNTDISGQELYERLRMQYHLQMEMVSGFYVLGMTSIMDSREGFGRLYEALKEIDEDARVRMQDEKGEFVHKLYAPKRKCMEFFEAMDLPSVPVPFDEAVGCVAGSMVSLYPPGIPFLVPGEAIDAKLIKNIRKCIKERQNLRGIADIQNEKITVVEGVFYGFESK